MLTAIFTSILLAGNLANPGILLFEQGVELSFTPRTPQQMAAFYEARRFPRAMIDILSQQCFITVRVHNKSKHVIWMELANWRFSSNGQPVQRYHRNDWKKRWQEMNMPQASQSTFRWTLLPEKLDYQPDEAEGGNIILPATDTPLTLELDFRTGQDAQGSVIHIHYENLYCAQDTAE